MPFTVEAPSVYLDWTETAVTECHTRTVFLGRHLVPGQRAGLVSWHSRRLPSSLLEPPETVAFSIPLKTVIHPPNRISSLENHLRAITNKARIIVSKL